MNPRRSRHWRLLLGALLLGTAACERMPGVDPAPAGDPDDVLARITRPADGHVHLVRLAQRGDQYAFEPPEIRIGTGDVVRFVLAGSQPESVVFDAADASPEAAEFIREHRLDLGELLVEPGQAYDVGFRDAPPGRYPFFSIPHAGHGMRGAVVIEDP